MKKFGNLVVNFDDMMYYFYEWDENDKIEYVKEIPLIKVNKKIFKTILSNHIKIKKDFFDKIKNKTLINQSAITALVISDTNNALVLEFDKYGNDIAISTLGVEDELDVCENVIKERNENISFEIIEKRLFNSVGRKDNYIKNYIKIELEDLYKSKDINKLSYFYRELFCKDFIDFEHSYQELQESLNRIKKEHYYLYDLMVLAHKKSGLSN